MYLLIQFIDFKIVLYCLGLQYFVCKQLQKRHLDVLSLQVIIVNFLHTQLKGKGFHIKRVLRLLKGKMLHLLLFNN